MNPLCVMCKAEGINRQTYAVDHIIPHRGDQTLFWDETNWQPLCQEHHNKTKKQIETIGYSCDVDAHGYPTDPNHPNYLKV